LPVTVNRQLQSRIKLVASNSPTKASYSSCWLANRHAHKSANENPTAANGGTATVSSSFNVLMSVHRPARNSNASKVCAAGSTIQIGNEPDER